MSDKLIQWNTPFFNTEWLVCEEVFCCGNYNLDIRLVAHHPVKKQDDEGLPQKNVLDIDTLIATSTPIVRTQDSEEWQVFFKETIAFKFGNESYYYGPETHDNQKLEGKSYILQPSAWMLEIGKSGYFPESCQHYVIISDHTIIEVISAEEPNIYSGSEIKTQSHTKNVLFFSKK